MHNINMLQTECLPKSKHYQDMALYTKCKNNSPVIVTHRLLFRFLKICRKPYVGFCDLERHQRQLT
jgi:hypothetical protein